MPQHTHQAGPLTVLHLAQPVEGGVARVVTDLVRAQTADGIHTVVACPPGGSLPVAARAAGAEVHPWRAGRQPGPGLAAETRAVARLIRQFRPDVVHTHSAKAGLAGRLAVRGRVPTVHQPHAWSFEAVGGAAARAALHWERFATRWTTRLLCVSEDERARGRDARVAAAWSVIGNGVDLTRFSPAAGDTTGLRPPAPGGDPVDGEAPAGASGGASPLVVCVARLCAQKGQDVLLRAWPEVTARIPGARLVLVGDGPDHDLLRASAPAGVRFAGAADDPVPWYRAADLVVLPSRWEGMALAPLEAMACGRPVVVSDVGGARQSLPPGTAPDCVVPPGDPEALAAALNRLLRDAPLRDRLGRLGRHHVRTNHDVRHTATAVSDLYRELLVLPHQERRERIRR